MSGGVGLALGAVGVGWMTIMYSQANNQERTTLNQLNHALKQQHQKTRVEANNAVKRAIKTAEELNQQKTQQLQAVNASVVDVETAVTQANLASIALMSTTARLQLTLVIAAKSMRITEDELKRTRDELATVTKTLKSTQAALAEKAAEAAKAAAEKPAEAETAA